MIDRFERFSFAISEISRYWHKLAADVMEPHGLKGPSAVYFTTIYQYPDGITSAKLAEICRRDKADVSRTLAAMEKLGMIERESNNQNRYRALVKLTDKGRELTEHINDRAKQAVEFGGQDMSDKEREIFYNGLETIANNLQTLSKEGIHNK